LGQAKLEVWAIEPGRWAAHTRRLAVAAATVVLVAAAVTVAVIGSQPTRRGPKPPARDAAPPRVAQPARKPRGPFAVGLRVLRLVDPSRLIGSESRKVLTVVRYPAVGAPSATDITNAPPARAGGPFPLVVFAHGYRLAPYTYSHLLQAWAHAGYVVAAPAFPLTNADAPVVDRSDLVNQPQDLRFVVSRLLAQSGAPLRGLIDSTRIALGGHSDGVDTALAVVYDGSFRDRRIRAALGFSGAEIAAFTGFSGSSRGVPLLAAQGTADSVNSPSGTYSYFAYAPRPKFLLTLFRAAHTAPYQNEQPHLGIVARVSTAFLDLYLKRDAGAGRRIADLGAVPGLAAIHIRR
jgi:dienelactone hydrolase